MASFISIDEQPPSVHLANLINRVLRQPWPKSPAKKPVAAAAAPAPAAKSAKSPAAKSAKSPAAKSAKSPATKSAKSPAAKSAKSPATKSAKSPAPGAAKSPVKAKSPAPTKVSDVAVAQLSPNSVNSFKDKKNFLKLLQTVFLPAIPKVLAFNETIVDSVFSLAYSVLQQINPKDLKEIVPQICKALNENPHNTPVLKLTLLTTLFNLLAEKQTLRFETLQEIVRLALASQHAKLVHRQFGQNEIDNWASEWKMNDAESRHLNDLAHQIHEQAGDLTTAREFLVRSLRSLEKASSDELHKSIPLAVKAVTLSIRMPQLRQCDELLELKAIRQLHENREHARTYELFEIFALKDVKAFSAFNAANKGFIASLGLDEEELEQKIRAMTICSLAESHLSISYSLLKKHLELKEDDEVEDAVIDAVASGWIEAKIDEENEVVVIERHTQRVFKKETWKSMGQKLKKWRDNVSKLTNTFTDLRLNDHHAPQQRV